MYQVLIADDDYLVRSYLKTLNSWERAGYEIAADVRDGEEALEALRDKTADVLITDISMPLMDGIELIRRVREKNQQIYIVVLSCHDDFKYVKEAMRQGANEYILKNALEEEPLYELLKNISGQIAQKKEDGTRQEQERKLIKMGSQALKYHFFNQLISGRMSPQEKQTRQAEAGIRGRYVNSAVLCIFLKNWGKTRESLYRLEEEQYVQYILGILTEQLDQVPEIRDETEVVYLGAGVFCCFLDLSEVRRSSIMRQRLTSAASVCYRCLRGQNHRFGISVSNICMGEEGIRQAYQQARELMKQSFYSEEEILYYDQYKPFSQELPERAKELLEHLEAYGRGRPAEELPAEILKVLAEFRKNNTDSRLVIQWQKCLDQKLKLERSPDFYHEIAHIQILKEAALTGVPVEDRKKELPKGVGTAVQLAARYVQKHYKQPIGLPEAAEAAGVNAAYLSYLFKQEMGVGFSNYLLECRIEEAKELLKTTNLKIKDVSARAGFNDYHYFSKTFKKNTGVSPADFRKQEHETGTNSL